MDKKLMIFLTWLWSVTAASEFMIAVCADSTDERVLGIALGFVYAGGAIGFFLAYRKIQKESLEESQKEVAYTVEQMLEAIKKLEVMKMRMEEMMRQNVHREDDQEAFEAKYEELELLYERMTAHFVEALEIIKEKEQYIKNLNDIIDAKNEYIKGLEKMVAVPEQYIKDAEDLGATDE